MTALRQWGDEWIIGEGHEPVELVHRTCGAAVHRSTRAATAVSRSSAATCGPWPAGSDDPVCCRPQRARPAGIVTA